MKTCPKCRKEHRHHTRMCQPCYGREWRAKKEPRPCSICGKMKVSFTTKTQCDACYQRARNGRMVGICADCGQHRCIPSNGRCLYCDNRRRRAEAKPIICLQCGREAPHFAKGICRSCYTNNTKRRGKYGIEPEQYIAMVKDQRGLCAICERPMKRHPHMDHCHVTGIIRGLLCYTCNVGLGSFGDDPERLRAAARYIEAHRSRKVA